MLSRNIPYSADSIINKPNYCFLIEGCSKNVNFKKTNKFIKKYDLMLYFCVSNLKVSHVGKIIIVALVLGLKLFNLPNVSWGVLVVV